MLCGILVSKTGSKTFFHDGIAVSVNKKPLTPASVFFPKALSSKRRKKEASIP